MSEQPYKVNVPDAALTLLHQKLKLTRLPDELEDAGWAYGAPLVDIKRLVARWRDGFDWRKVEAEINAIPQFTRDITVEGFSTLNVHYIHQRSEIVNAVPLLIVHGWPGHVLEAQKLLPLLTAASPDHPSFHVVVIGLPGFSFSEGPKEKGFSIPQHVEVCHKLMLSLGYDEYAAQGGDWGYVVCRELAIKYGGKHMKAWHTNFSLALAPSFWKDPWLFLVNVFTPYTEEEKAGREFTKWWKERSSGYHLLQSTQPQTIGYSLADSPVGLLAWLYEKLVTWTDEYHWEDDEVLAWVSIYWFSCSGPGASLRIYYEANNNFDEIRHSNVPMGLSYFPKELQTLRKSSVRAMANVVFESTHKKGGHFAAHECPNELADDIRRMFSKGGPAYGIVSGKDGYA